MISIILLYLPSSQKHKNLEFAVGIDIGGTYTKLGLISRRGEIIDRSQLDTRDSLDEASYFQALFSAIGKLTAAYKSDQIAGIGIGAPGCNERDGTLEGTANMIFKGVVPFRQIVADQFPWPVQLVKDSSAAALGELHFGGGRNMRSFILLTLGTGLGSGVVINGRVITGHLGLASEFGHATVDPQGRRCGCGRRGCLETYVSATGLKRTVFQLLAEETSGSPLREFSFNQLTARHIFEAATNGDELAIEAFRLTAHILGDKIADLYALLEPEAVFLSGGMSQAGALLLNPLNQYLADNVLHLFRGKTRVLISELGGNEAALLGAASLLLNQPK